MDDNSSCNVKTTEGKVKESPFKAIISIGPHTDTLMDQLNFPDQLLPGIHHVMGKFHSGHWASILEGPQIFLKA